MHLPENALPRYQTLLAYLEDRFRSIRKKHAHEMQCGRGCALCCHGLFDISIPDALNVAEGFLSLPNPVRHKVAERASAIQASIARECPELQPPYILDVLPETIDRIVDALTGVRCPLLDERDACLIYKNRPIQCRLEGIPMVDVQDGLFGDWCELNFVKGISSEIMRDLVFDYSMIREAEGDMTILIPSVITSADVLRLMVGG